MRALCIVFLIGIFTACAKETNTDSFIKLDLSESRDTTKNFYYYDSTDIVTLLPTDYSSLFVHIKKNGMDTTIMQSIFSKYSQIDGNNSKIEIANNTFRIKLVKDISKEEYYGLLKSLNENEYFDFITPVFLYDERRYDTRSFGVWDRIQVKPLIDNEDFNNNLIYQYPNLIVESTLHSGNRFIKINVINNGFEAIDIANEIHNQDGIFWAFPGFETFFEFLK